MVAQSSCIHALSFVSRYSFTQWADQIWSLEKLLKADGIAIPRGSPFEEAALTLIQWDEVNAGRTEYDNKIDHRDTLYFFSHDLMLTYAGLITGARPKVLLWTLQSAMNHVPTLGLSNSPIDSTLKGIATEIKESGKKVDDETRADLAQTIWNVARRTGDEFARAQDQQPKG